MIKPGDLVFIPSVYKSKYFHELRKRWNYSLTDDSTWRQDDFVAIVIIGVNAQNDENGQFRNVEIPIDTAIEEDRFLLVLSNGQVFETDAGGVTLL